MARERNFRMNQVIPFLKKLQNTAFFPIQQIAIHGDADFILCMRGRFTWLELKDTGEVLRPLQQYKADWVTQMGGVAIRATPENWRKTKERLRKLDEGDYENEY